MSNHRIVAAAPLLAAVISIGLATVAGTATSDDIGDRVEPLPSRVVVADNATEVEMWAAGKLADLLGLPPSSSRAPEAAALQQEHQQIVHGGVTQIAVGFGAAVALGVPPAELASLGDDSYLIRTTAQGVAIASSARSARGTVYGAFAFLRVIGFEFFAENATRIPSPLPTTMPAMDMIYSPSYESRNLVMASPGIGSNRNRTQIKTKNCSAVAKAEGWHDGECQGENGTSWWRPGTNFSAALGLNGYFSFGPVGGNLSPHEPPGFVATAFNLLTPSLDSNAADCAGPGTFEPHEHNTVCPAVYRQHPEWFACGRPCTPASINKTYSAQPCWSAPGVEETMTQNVQRILRAYPTTQIISVSNMDGSVSFSPCPLDMPAAKAENATGAANFYVVRNIAAAVANEFPKVRILALAYNGAHAPPKHLVFAPNVIVQIAGFNLPDVSLYHMENADNLALVKGWLDHAQTVYIWNGIEKSVILPHGDVLAQGLHIKELAELGVKGYFAEGSTEPGSDMVDLRVFLAARLTFNASLDIDTLVGAFLETYYGGGAAAESVGKYIRLMAMAFQTGNRSVDFAGRVMDPREARACGLGPNSSFFANDTLLTGAELLTDALKAATEPRYRERIAYDFMHLQYVLLVRWDSLRINATAMHKPWPLHDSKADEFEVFAAACNSSDIQWFTEETRVPGNSHRYEERRMTLASFHAELFGH